MELEPEKIERYKQFYKRLAAGTDYLGYYDSDEFTRITTDGKLIMSDNYKESKRRQYGAVGIGVDTIKTERDYYIAEKLSEPFKHYGFEDFLNRVKSVTPEAYEQFSTLLKEIFRDEYEEFTQKSETIKKEQPDE